MIQHTVGVVLFDKNKTKHGNYFDHCKHNSCNLTHNTKGTIFLVLISEEKLRKESGAVTAKYVVFFTKV